MNFTWKKFTWFSRKIYLREFHVRNFTWNSRQIHVNFMWMFTWISHGNFSREFHVRHIRLCITSCPIDCIISTFIEKYQYFHKKKSKYTRGRSSYKNCVWSWRSSYIYIHLFWSIFKVLVTRWKKSIFKICCYQFYRNC